MKLSKLFSILTLTLCLGMFLNSCDETTTDPVVTPVTLKAPTALMATSKSDKEVILKWTASASESEATFAGYKVFVDGSPIQAPAAKGVTNYTVKGLTEKAYNFVIKSVSTDGTYSADSVKITWAPAWRFSNDEKIKMYESKSSNGSGLNIFDTDESFPYTDIVDNIQNWTVGIDNKTDNVIKFGPAKSLSYTVTGKTLKNVVISSTYTEADSLDEVFDSKALDTKTFNGTAEYLDLNTVTTSKKGIVIIIKETVENKDRYAKIFLKKGTSGFFNGTGNNRFVNAEVSYQKVLGLPYAK